MMPLCSFLRGTLSFCINVHLNHFNEDIVDLMASPDIAYTMLNMKVWTLVPL